MKPGNRCVERQGANSCGAFSFRKIRSGYIVAVMTNLLLNEEGFLMFPLNKGFLLQ